MNADVSYENEKTSRENSGPLKRQQRRGGGGMEELRLTSIRDLARTAN